jgi:hypothetical protein
MAKKNELKDRGTKPPSRDRLIPKINFPFRGLIPVLVIAGILVIVFAVGSAANRGTAPAATKLPPIATNTTAPTGTADPCATALISADVDKVDALMLEFYDASALASQTPINELLQIIPNLQEIRRRAQALKVSACLVTLQSYQLSHMNMVINTLLAFMSKSDQSVLMEGIVQSRLLNEAYKKEKARLLGVPYVPPATATPSSVPGTVEPTKK